MEKPEWKERSLCIINYLRQGFPEAERQFKWITRSSASGGDGVFHVSFLTESLTSVHKNTYIYPKSKKNPLKYATSLNMLHFLWEFLQTKHIKTLLSVFLHQRFHFPISHPEIALSKDFKYIQMTKSNQMAFPHFLFILNTLAFDIVDQILPSHKLFLPGYLWQCINIPNHLLSICLFSLS